jgi:exosome complex component RRP42
MAKEENSLRLDGRKEDEYRKPIEVKVGISKSAEGSAWAKIGNTEVIAGVKMKTGEPFPDTPDNGVLITTAELLPMSSPAFQPGPPSQKAIEISRIIDRGIRESKMIDLKKLCVRKGELVWTIFLDMYTMNDDGNLIDTAALAALAALKSAVLPKLDGDKVVFGEFTKTPLPLKALTVTTTIAKVGSDLIVDPTTDEEELLTSRLSVATSEKGAVHALQMGGSQGMTREEIKKAMEIGKKASKELRKALK